MCLLGLMQDTCAMFPAKLTNTETLNNGFYKCQIGIGFH